MNIAKKINYVNGQIEDLGTDDPVMLPDVNKATVERIVNFLEHIGDDGHAPSIPAPIVSSNLELDDWYNNFF